MGGRRSRSVVWWSALALAMLAPMMVAAAEPVLDVVVASGPVTVGDRLSLRVAARGGDGGLWGELEISVSDSGPWTVVDPPRPVAGTNPPAWSVVVAPLAVGEIELPEMSVVLRTADGTTETIRPAEPQTVTVASVLPPEGETEPAPMRDPVGVAGFPWEWVGPAVAVLIPCAVFIWWLWRRRSAEPGPSTAHLPPLAEIERLVAELEKSIGREPAEGVCDRLAAGLRRYVERRCGFPALEMTSFELRALARRERWPDGVQRAVQRVLGLVDGIRFGRRSTTEADLREAVDLAGAAARGIESHLEPVVADGEVSVEVAS